jgi:hypothetical protein
MPLEELANIAEVVGMLVVGITLVFLVVQMRQSTKATRSATANHSVSMVAAWYQELGNNAQSSALLFNGLTDPDNCTPEQWHQFVFLEHAVFLTYQNSHYLATQGTLDARITQTITEAIVAIKDQPGFHRFWEQRKAMFYEEFQEFVDTTAASRRRVSHGLYSSGTGTDT